MPKKTKVTAKNKVLPPTTIAIHGDGFDIDASFRNDGRVKKTGGGGGLAKIVEQLATQFSVGNAGNVPTGVVTGATDPNSIQTMLGAFGVSLAQEQIDTFTPGQMILFDHLMAFAGCVNQPEQPEQPEGAQVSSSEHDFDIVKRVIDNGDPAVLNAVITLANAKLGEQRAESTPPS